MNKSNGIDLFERIIVGVFHNQKQIDQERTAGKQLHPFAKHVTEIITHRVHNVPSDFNGTLILEESYYDYPDKEQEIKPLFFKVTPNAANDIYLESIVIPEHMDKRKVVNANPDLSFDFRELQINQKFGKAEYKGMGDFMIANHLCDFGGGVSFNLTELLTLDTLYVLEMAKKDGHALTPYDTPIIYNRIS